MDINKITHEIIGAGIEVHSAFGPGMLESAYEKCFVYELAERGFFVESQVVLPLRYKQITIDAGYRLDVRVERQVIVEVKAVEQVLPVHKAQLLCYMRLSGCKVGLILNFNERLLVDGITRMILD
ncbi:MAG: GxxExxY protein [Acidobacteria bacterium]|nr:MAG: GxxExxY protein [Acidobacteriota bacterium]